VSLFAANVEGNLDRLYRRLQTGNYQFSPAIGVLKARPGKNPRPIVLRSVEDRVVQRSILEVLTNHPAVESFVNTPTSFGGLRKKGVREAVSAACHLVQDGARFYIRSDIGDFFRAIPRGRVLALVAEFIQDNEFLALLEAATDCEISNLEVLAQNANLFPTHEVGVAQGCCLSPLLGNVLLADFDAKMNDRGVRCLRYIDDFILLGASEGRVKKAFESAKRFLAGLNLSVYDPEEYPDKAQMGDPLQGFEFLGCSVTRGCVSPNSKALKRLMDGVKERLSGARQGWNLNGSIDYRNSLIESLWELSKFLQAWGNQYSFCNNGHLWESLDRKIDDLVGDHIGKYSKVRKNLKAEDVRVSHRRLLGVRSLIDCNKAPIYPLMRTARKISL
jgi:RNA-directed DNA polymerase